VGWGGVGWGGVGWGGVGWGGVGWGGVGWGGVGWGVGWGCEQALDMLSHGLVHCCQVPCSHM
jgi:hypothetical protein